MSDAARAEVLRRIRSALGEPSAGEAGGGAGEAGGGAGVPARGPTTEIPRAYRRDERPQEALVELFGERVRDYAAEAARIPADAVAEAVTEACARMGLERIAIAPGAPAAWRPGPGAGVALIDDDGLPAMALDEVGAVLTGCAVAIAETGTIVLDGRPPCGRRALTLVPDHHLCVVRAEQIVGQVPEAIAALAPAVIASGTPVTFVSGSSATSDIELERVEGVHGPRHLLVLIAG